MIRHLFKLIWNRKRANAAHAAEIFCSFLVALRRSSRSARYSSTTIGGRSASTDDASGRSTSTVRSARRRRAGRGPGCGASLDDRTRSSAASAAASPRRSGRWPTPLTAVRRATRLGYSTKAAGRTLEFTVDARAPTSTRTCWGSRWSRGRWFGREDDGGGWDAGGDQRRLGAASSSATTTRSARHHGRCEPGRAGGRERRVVGVVRDVSQEGEFDGPSELRASSRLAREPDDRRRTDRLPGACRALRPGDRRRVRGARSPQRCRRWRRDWSFEVEPMDECAPSPRCASRWRRSASRLVVAGFLLLMVALGLTGVLWQSVTRGPARSASGARWAPPEPRAAAGPRASCWSWRRSPCSVGAVLVPSSRSSMLVAGSAGASRRRPCHSGGALPSRPGLRLVPEPARHPHPPARRCATSAASRYRMILIVDDDAVGARVAGAAAEAGRVRARTPGDAGRGPAPGSEREPLRAGAAGHELLAPDDGRGRARAARARSRRCGPALPVILITAWGSIALAVEGMQAGAADFVTKPWTNAAAAAGGADRARSGRSAGAARDGAAPDAARSWTRATTSTRSSGERPAAPARARRSSAGSPRPTPRC